MPKKVPRWTWCIKEVKDRKCKHCLKHIRFRDYYYLVDSPNPSKSKYEQLIRGEYCSESHAKEYKLAQKTK